MLPPCYVDAPITVFVAREWVGCILTLAPNGYNDLCRTHSFSFMNGNRIVERLDIPAQCNDRNPQEQRARCQEFCQWRRIFPRSEALHGFKSTGQVECRHIQS